MRSFFGEGTLLQASSFDQVLEQLKLSDCAHFANFVQFKGAEYYVKYRTLKKSNKISKLLRGSGPFHLSTRAQEYRNLKQLKKLGIPVANPSYLAVDRTYGVVDRELLVSDKINAAVDLHSLCLTEDGSKRLTKALVATLGFEVGRMHNSGFRHRDLFLRNVLIDGDDQFYFIDCHKGSWNWWPTRCFVYDLACFEKWAATFFTVEQRNAFFGGYLTARPVADLDVLLAKVEKARVQLIHEFQCKRRNHQREVCPVLEAEALDQAAISAVRDKISHCFKVIM